MKEITKKYTNGEVTVVWKPNICIHSAICFTGLPQVFDPRNRPWINIGAAGTERIVNQVKQCPSGALSFYMNAAEQLNTDTKDDAEIIIEATPNGPLLVYGNLLVKEGNGKEEKKTNVTAFCRCGGSNNKPYCDGTHKMNGFTG
ncbi:MAG: (4Fe-4S)-binding protein [Ignavibacteriales bacterium]|nr:(4Fe-4S)-binding protein [Ignavibacteriales bacterium]